jgi:hypothetical protein
MPTIVQLRHSLTSRACLEIVGTTPSNQEEDEKPKDNEGCSKQEPQAAPLESD